MNRQLKYALRYAAIYLLCIVGAATQPAAAQTSTGFTSTSTPSLAVFSSQLFLAWTDLNTNPHAIKVAASSDGINFGSPVTLFGNNTSIPNAGPAIAAFNGKMYLTWTGGGNAINIASSTDGLNYSNKSLVKNPSNNSVNTAIGTTALAAVNGRLYLAWAGEDPNHSINVASSADGVNFTTPQTYLIQGQYGTPYSPALAVLSGNLYLGVTAGPAQAGLSGVFQLWLLDFSVDTSGNQTLVTTYSVVYSSPAGPGLGVKGNELGYAFLSTTGGANFNNLLDYTQQSNGTLLASPLQEFNTAAYGSPAIAGFNSQLFYAYTQNPGNTIYIMSVP
jgi:hypothetical protein